MSGQRARFAFSYNKRVDVVVEKEKNVVFKVLDYRAVLKQNKGEHK